MNKSIVFCVSTLSGGGAEGVCINLANELSEKMWDITIVVLNLKHSDYIHKVNKNVKLVSLNSSNARYSFFKIRAFIQNHKPTKVVCFDYMMTILFTLVRSTLIKNNFYLVMRNINTFSQKKKQKKTFKKFILYATLSLVFNKIDLIVNQCKAMKDDFLFNCNIDAKKVIYIYNPVDKKLEEETNNYYIDNDEKYFLCIGRLEEQKSFEYAIIAFSKFVVSHPEYRLKIVGKGSQEEYLKNLSDKCNILDKVDFEGFQKDTISYYKNAKATLLTSLYEGFPNVLLESITLGTAVLAFNCESGPKEIIVSGTNGYLVKYQDINDLAKKMENIVLNPISKSNIKSTSKKYYMKNILIKWEEILLR